ncbi:MAG: hypothetical protein ACFFD6_11410 [Candidatus Thorarchaeota archaeon]
MNSNRTNSDISISVVGGAGKMGILLAGILKDKVDIIQIVSRDVE